MFKEEREHSLFSWEMIGNIKEGRPNLGPMTYVSVYRLMQYTLRDTLIKEVGVNRADKIFYDAGEQAGREIFRNFLTPGKDFLDFINELQSVLKNLKIGILRVEESNLDKLQFTITVEEDLDCSGLSPINEVICTYDEGFIKGILSEYSGQNFSVKEVDCWASGERVCRFKAHLE
jgi:uncharacterized protein